MRKSLGYLALFSLMVLLGYLTLTNVIFTAKPINAPVRPVLALVVDDFGGADASGVKELLELKQPITAAVMPNLINSTQHAQAAHRQGHEVILHQPMEPVRGKASWLGPGAINSNMSAQEIKETFQHNLESIPHAKGFNNHTGSKITGSKEKMIPMLEVVKAKGLYVLDSRTSSKSQVIPVAKNLHIPWVKRDIFLDDVKSKSHIHKQIKKACKVARKQGYAVAIGHVGQGGKITAAAIKEALPYIEKEGIKLVPLSEVVHLNNGKGKI